MVVCKDIDPSPYGEFNAAAKETVTSPVHPQSRTSGEWVNRTDYRCRTWQFLRDLR
jgi:hypothetical protein